ncbi:MAG: serine/threonine-protein phosphatase [Abitibacteriaceae bacterium]|nr:serine/threonine-protein phosphatase [Abditibacteriaceae bacterium]
MPTSPRPSEGALAPTAPAPSPVRHAAHTVAPVAKTREIGSERASEDPSSTQDAELIVAVFRTMVLIFALVLPRIFPVPSTYNNQIWLAALTGVYNIATGIACIYPSRLGLRRPFIVIMDGLLITAWIRFSDQWELFPFYYVVVVIAAMWFRVLGGVLAAAFSCFFFFLFFWGGVAGDPTQARGPVLPIPLALNAAILFLVGALVGYIAEAQERERERRLEGQLLIANYEREIDLATQLQPLLISSQWAGGSAEAGEIGGVGETANPLKVLGKTLDPALEIGAAMKSARTLGGGDYFDVIPLDEARTALCIADVSGKSARAQARLPLLKYALRALAPLYPSADAVGALMNRLNEILAPDLQPEYFIAFCYLVLDSRQQTITWCNAGHIAPLLLPHQPASPGAPFAALDACGPPLGMFPEMTYTTRSAPWCPGDQLLLFTDGLTDAFSYEASEDGEAQVRQLALRLTSKTAAADADNYPLLSVQQIAQEFLDLASTILDETALPANQVQALLSPLLRRSATLNEAGAGHRDDITVVLVRAKAEPQG